MSRLRQLIHEVHRRSLWQVLAIYVASSWVALQVVDLLVDNFGLPDWFPAFALSLLVIGLPVVLATAFVQEGAATSHEAPPPARSDAAVAPPPRPMGPSREGRRPGLRGLLTWRNALAGGVFAFALWGVAASGWFLLSEDRGSPAAVVSGEVSLSRVAVFPFGVRSGEELAYLGEGLVNLLSTKLDGAGELRTVDPRALLSLLARDGASLDPGTARTVAERVGAGLYVMGDVLELGGRLRLDAALYEVGDAEPVARGTVGGEADSIFGMIDDLAVQLLGGRLDSPGQRMARIATLTTHSLPALKAYLEGERAFRAGHFEEALAALREAVEVDTAFALAYYRMSATAQWLGQRYELERRAAEQALRHADRLSERDRLLLEAALAASRGEAEEAERLYREIVTIYPNDVEAWYQLGEVLFHHGPMRARSFTTSREAWERILAYEPDHLPSLVHVALIAATEDRRAELDSIVRRELEIAPESDHAIPERAVLAYETGDTAAQRRLLDELGNASKTVLSRSAYAVGAFVEDLEGAIRLAELMTASNRAPWTRLSGHLILAHLELGRGRWRAAEQALAAGGELDPTLALHYRALLSLAPFLASPEPELAALRDSLAAGRSPRPDELRSTAARSSSSAERSMEDLVTAFEPQRRSYLLGLLEAKLGNDEAALRHAEELEAAEAPADAGSLVDDMALAVRAQAALDRGRFEEALGSLEDVRGEANYNVLVSSGFFLEARERFVRAGILAGLGRDDEALRWFASFAHHSLYALPYLAPSHLRRAEILERRGDAEAALRHYRRFVELWRDADPELQLRVREARARIDEIAAERG